jgi:hypothetical protein
LKRLEDEPVNADALPLRGTESATPWWATVCDDMTGVLQASFADMTKV